MKRYKYTWFNGMLEDPKGEYVKEKDANKELARFAYLISDEEIISFILKWLLSLSILGNCGQLLYHINT